MEVVAWAAGNGDRSENADYQYGKRRLRQIDGRIRFLTKRIEAAEVVDPESPRADQQAKRAFFGSAVRYANAAGLERAVSSSVRMKSILTATTSVGRLRSGGH
ncbi:hypothetical protein [Terriglobus roseus]|uniref:hypothetical protein n=1 Tax=Terriglobus roseus TaxID=392734 RepID=UPI000AF9EF73|nr:hypothetical protein [Terriglobus roseus]